MLEQLSYRLFAGHLSAYDNKNLKLANQIRPTTLESDVHMLFAIPVQHRLHCHGNELLIT